MRAHAHAHGYVQHTLRTHERMHARKHVSTHARTHTNTHTQAHTNMHKHTHTYAQPTLAQMHLHTHTPMRACAGPPYSPSSSNIQGRAQALRILRLAQTFKVYRLLRYSTHPSSKSTSFMRSKHTNLNVRQGSGGASGIDNGHYSSI